MRGGGVAADPFGELDAIGGGAALEELLDAAVDEPQPGLELEDGLADDGEAEVAGLDEAGVDRADRDLVDARPFDGEERVATRRRSKSGGSAGVAAHRVPVLGPVGVADEPFAARGGRPAMTPNRSAISRSKRPAGKDSAGQRGQLAACRAAAVTSSSTRRSGDPARNR